TNINIGQLQMQQRKYPEAIAAFRTALASEPASVTATYNLAMALTRSGERQEGQTMMQKFQVLRQAPYATTVGQNYLEQARYAEAISSTGAEVVDAATPDVAFSDATSSMLSGILAAKPLAGNVKQPGGVVPFDFDGDGDLDLLQVGFQSVRLFRNDAGKFVD